MATKKNARALPRLFELLPYLYIAAGLATMALLGNALALASGAILVAVGGVELWRRHYRRTVHLDDVASRLHEERDAQSALMLVPIQWSAKLECGHPIIDEQHQRLFEIGSRLIRAVHRGLPRAQVQAQLEGLIDHIRTHFETEEAVLARTRFPLTEEHRGHHHWLLTTAESLSERYRNGETLVGEMVAFITDDVITEHILREDLKFALRPSPAQAPAAPALAPVASPAPAPAG